MSTLPSEVSLSDVSVITAIHRRADSYVDMVERARDAVALRARETHLIDQFERFTADILDRYDPGGRRSRESLAFARIYSAWDPGLPDDERRRGLITALMAAEVETRGPLQLTRAQNSRLASIFIRIGKECRAEGLLLHAELAFERAAGIYLVLGENATRDYCLYSRMRARHLAMRPGWGKLRMDSAWLLCGYGYKPFFLLLWIAAQLVVFSIVAALSMDGSVSRNIYLSLSNYLDPRSADGVSGLTQVLFVVESYFGLVSMSVFFALVLHRWFRI